MKPLARIPLDIVVTATGQSTSGVLVAVLAADLDAIEAVHAPLDLLESLVEDEDCSFDHHGGCQAHGYLSLEQGEVCPQQQLKDLIDAATAARPSVAPPSNPPRGET